MNDHLSEDQDVEEELSQAEQMSQENGLDEDINQAYIDLVGKECATADAAQEAYSGQYNSDEEFAEDYANELGLLTNIADGWPYRHIDWESAAKELMMDYDEQNGFYFRRM